jgi:G:T/U-mismatch repair DNA glycosylase
LPHSLAHNLLLLLLLQIGHNPSEHAWHTGHYYSNPSNRMWRILEAAGNNMLLTALLQVAMTTASRIDTTHQDAAKQ